MSDLHAPAYDTAKLPYKVAVLCYLWDAQGRLLMLHLRCRNEFVAYFTGREQMAPWTTQR